MGQNIDILLNYSFHSDAKENTVLYQSYSKTVVLLFYVSRINECINHYFWNEIQKL
jgi:hypothetical protein